jgi:hypothetical protein
VRPRISQKLGPSGTVRQTTRSECEDPSGKGKKRVRFAEEPSRRPSATTLQSGVLSLRCAGESSRSSADTLRSALRSSRESPKPREENLRAACASRDGPSGARVPSLQTFIKNLDARIENLRSLGESSQSGRESLGPVAESSQSGGDSLQPIAKSSQSGRESLQSSVESSLSDETPFPSFEAFRARLESSAAEGESSLSAGALSTSPTSDEEPSPLGEDCFESFEAFQSRLEAYLWRTQGQRPPGCPAPSVRPPRESSECSDDTVRARQRELRAAIDDLRAAEEAAERELRAAEEDLLSELRSGEETSPPRDVPRRDPVESLPSDSELFRHREVSLLENPLGPSESGGKSSRPRAVSLRDPVESFQSSEFSRFSRASGESTPLGEETMQSSVLSPVAYTKTGTSSIEIGDESPRSRSGTGAVQRTGAVKKKPLPRPKGWL